ncbi:hypothetical protein [Sphingobacterium sp.]|uniref:hypothetical protein n=1 Tax=Sphingobacterium sp. TaxID=341027 RepID=UPI0031E222CA
MEKLSLEEIEKYLTIDKEIIGSANSSNSKKGIWDEDGDTISSITQTSTMLI